MSNPINQQPILFLDIDGPLVTTASGGKEQADPDTAVFKPEAVQFVNDLVRIAGAKIVVISDWAGRCMTLDGQRDPSTVSTRLIRAFSRNGLVHDQFHSVWTHLCLIGHPKVNKRELMDSHGYMRGFRPAYWLKTQGAHSHYAILDDSPCFHPDELFGGELTKERPMHPGYVHVDRDVGINRQQFDQALELLIEGVRD